MPQLANRPTKLVTLGAAAVCLWATTFRFAGDAAGRDASESAPPAGDRLVIHEWGTFTCLQDENGRTISGVNTDDEAVPEFVHRISELIPHPSELAPVYYKGVPRSHREVRMRLETPVLYFYPPAGTNTPLHASVKVGFRGGWLTEYYPNAQVSAPGLQKGDFRYGRITPQTVGSLHWHDLTIGGAGGRVPETDAPVWLAPRQVRAATVRVPGGEAEKYLFYRGVGNIPSPVSVTRDRERDGLVVRENGDSRPNLARPQTLSAMWLVHVRDDTTVAYRALGSAELTGERDRVLARAALRFKRPPAGAPDTAEGPVAAGSQESLFSEYSTRMLDELRVEMRQALIADGLFADEADAMLKTWELAYFKSPGLRLFYLLPQAWTDAVLPLECSLPANVSRTMVGRIEIVTPRQRELLRQISRGPASSSDWFFRNIDNGTARGDVLNQLWAGKARFSDFKLPVPVDYQAYVDLGRFRNALILDAQSRDADRGLNWFSEAYHIEYYTPEESGVPTAGTQ